MDDGAPDIGLTKFTSLGMDEPKLTRGFSFTLIQEHEIEQKQSKMVEEIMDTLGINQGIARGLLIKFMWNKENLINRYYENDNLVR